MKLLALVNILVSIFMFDQLRGQSQFVNSPDSVRIAYEVHGDGRPALIFVHGWSCDRSYWKNQVGTFSKNFKVVMVDLGGHGESGLGRKSWTMEAFGSDVAAVIKKLGLKRVVLVGHSMGGDVIAETARQLQDIVTGLIMIDTYKKLGPGRTPEQVQAFVAKLRTDFKDSTSALVRSMFVARSDSSLVNWVAADMSSAPPDIALDALEHSFSYSRQMPHTLEQIKLPVIALNSDNSPTDVESMEHYGVQVMIMNGVGHFMMMEEPDRFNRLLKTAINKLLQ
ncbi:MAG TPA: alpha/beta hydrolase [Chitinophagaceae bacterium]|jgi:pimeloyl-ACP methyl ester carboxylesterase|nr:alpha/beta hydrolase [Chitinophagaceae bacterium]